MFYLQSNPSCRFDDLNLAIAAAMATGDAVVEKRIVEGRFQAHLVVWKGDEDDFVISFKTNPEAFDGIKYVQTSSGRLYKNEWCILDSRGDIVHVCENEQDAELKLLLLHTIFPHCPYYAGIQTL